MYSDIYYMSQYIRDLGFTEDEYDEFFGIIKTSVEEGKDPESQIAYSGNRKYIESFSLLSNSFTSDWYYYATQSGFPGGNI